MALLVRGYRGLALGLRWERHLERCAMGTTPELASLSLSVVCCLGKNHILAHALMAHDS